VAIHPARQCHEDDPQPDRVDHGPSLLSGPPLHPLEHSAELSDSTVAEIVNLRS
jgi:hypothetical protein